MAKKESVVDLLNQAVADLSQFSAIIHQTHWYMRGPRFLSLHPLMDELMAEINEQLDLVAERLITVGGAPYSTLNEFASHTKLEDTPGDFGVSEEKRMQKLLECYQYIADLYKSGIEAAEKGEDPVTEDLFTGLKGAIDKKIWMVSAALGNEPPAL